MAQLKNEVSRENMFHEDYPYRSSGSVVVTDYFVGVACMFPETELTGPDPFIVEIGFNDGVMLSFVADNGIRHLGVELLGGAAEVASRKGIRVPTDFFPESSGAEIADAEDTADVIYAATRCAIFRTWTPCSPA
ncbi:hypothetical protein [Kibdelosporangium aridum]|uniref:hypothetical protein n=1 Tax=Kibdelosporangium aridum TaxID=2030 RepID=UPI0036D29A1A